MNIHFIKSSEKKELLNQLNEVFGISSIPYLLIESGKEKIRGFSGSLSKEEILDLAKIAKIEVIGLYLIRREREDDLRLSFDGTRLLKDQIKKRIVEVNEEQFNSWIRGNDLDISTEKGPVVIKYGLDFLGCGKSNGLKIFNYVPKDRRLKK